MIHESQLTNEVLAFIATYGFVAVFVYMVLETSMLLHFVPSEVVLPVVISLLVSDILTFFIFITIATAGAVVGSLVAYYLIGRNTERALRVYGGYISRSI